MDVLKLQKKLQILKTGSVGVLSGKTPKTRKERIQFWSDIMDGADKVSDKLKASELLGKASADFTEKVEHTGADGGPITVAPPMDTSGLKNAIRNQPKICGGSSKLLTNSNV